MVAIKDSNAPAVLRQWIRWGVESMRSIQERETRGCGTSNGDVGWGRGCRCYLPSYCVLSIYLVSCQLHHYLVTCLKGDLFSIFTYTPAYLSTLNHRTYLLTYLLTYLHTSQATWVTNNLMTNLFTYIFLIKILTDVDKLTYLLNMQTSGNYIRRLIGNF